MGHGQNFDKQKNFDESIIGFIENIKRKVGSEKLLATHPIHQSFSSLSFCAI